MDLTFSPEEEAFRAEVRAFVEQNLPAAIRDKLAGGHHPSKDDIVTWTRILHKKGWGAPGWPVDHGGPDWTPAQRWIFEAESARECEHRRGIEGRFVSQTSSLERA